MARKIPTLLLMLTFTSTVFAQNPAKLWLEVLKACGVGANDKHVVFLGTGNNEGPGSIWSLHDGPVLQSKATESFGSQAAIDSALSAASKTPAPCGSTKVPHWNVGADVPVNVSSIGNAEAKFSLTQTKNVTASANSVALVAMPTSDIWAAINKLGHDNPHFISAANGRSFALVNA